MSPTPAIIAHNIEPEQSISAGRALDEAQAATPRRPRRMLVVGWHDLLYLSIVDMNQWSFNEIAFTRGLLMLLSSDTRSLSSLSSFMPAIAQTASGRQAAHFFRLVSWFRMMDLR